MMAEQAVSASARVIEVLSGAFIAQAVYVAAKLGIADRLVAGPVTGATLARDLAVDEVALTRVMRLLVAQGIFAQAPSGEYANTPLSSTLTTGGGESLRDLAIWWCEEPHWRVFGHLLESVRTGRPAWPMVHGMDLFAYLTEANPPLGAIFHRAMTSFSGTTIPAVLAAHDFSGCGVVADIGGGHGHLLAAILAAAPHTGGILFDLPAAVAGAPEQFATAGVADRARIVTGSFFDPLPFTADTVVLKHILHDWPDDDCVRLLGRVRDALPARGRVLVVEMVVPDTDSPHFSKVCDIEMLVSVGGRERSPTEFARLFAAAGLRMTKVVPTASVVSIIEATLENAP